jgi:IS605 OrfB family transposase
MRNENHVIGKIIANGSIGYGIAVEHLTGIRETTDPKKSNKNSKKQGISKYNQTSWAFSDLQTKLEYKTYLNGSPFIYVDPHRTSIRCPECRHESTENRPNGAKIFCCVKCGLTANSDAIGASNIKENADIVLLIAGQLSSVPNVPKAGVPAPEWKDFWREKFSAGLQSLLRTSSVL